MKPLNLSEKEIQELTDIIAEQEKSLSKPTIFERLIKSLNTIGSMAREGILDISELDFNLQDYVDIATGKREVTGRDFLKRYHKDDKKYEPSFLASLATDIITDPLTYTPIKATTQLAKAGLGAGLGLAGSHYTDSPTEVLRNVAVGAALGPVAGKGLEAAGGYIGKKGSELVDKYYKSTRKSEFDIVSKFAKEMDGPETVRQSEEFLKKSGTKEKKQEYFKKSYERKAEIIDELVKTSDLNTTAKEILDLPFAKDKGVRDFLQKDVNSVADEIFMPNIAKGRDKTIRYRNKKIDEIVEPIFQKEVAGRNLKKDELAAIKQSIWNDVFAKESNRLTEEANTIVGKRVFRRIEKYGDPALTKAVKDFVDHNRDMVYEYNKVHGTHQVPIDFHTADTV